MQGQAKGPNALNIMAYMHGDEEEELEEATSSRPNIDTRSIEDQFDNFVKDMQKYDRILSEVARNIEEVGGEGDFITDFYPRFIWESTYEEDQEKRIVANSDPELAKIIDTLERNNRLLKDDMRSWVLEFAKTARLTELLIAENKLLRTSVAKKNSEIVTMIQTIGQADNQDIAELAENLDLLREENGVLKDHLHTLQAEVQQKRQEQQRVTEAVEKAREELGQVEKRKAEAEDEEEHLSKTYELVEQWRAEAEKRRRKLEKEKEELLRKRQELEGEKDKIERELDICSREKKDLEGGLKKEFHDLEEQKYRLMEEIHELGDRISKQKEESRYYDEETTRNLAKTQEYDRLAKDYARKAAESEQRVKEAHKEYEAAQAAEVAVLCQIELEQFDLTVLQQQARDYEEREKRAGEEWKRSQKRAEEARNREVAEWQSKLSQNQRELAMRILQERSELSTKQKELERWEQKVYEKKEELSDLKTQMKEIRDNQARLADLKAKLHLSTS